MTTIDDFKCYLEKNQAKFDAWGHFVASEIQDKLSKIIYPVPVTNFLKLEPKPRVKGVSSALAKVGRKNYEYPKIQMTDLVGVRFVVLLAKDIPIVCDVIGNSEHWNAELSRDFKDEIKKNPKVFDYQSKHYELRPKKTITTKEGLVIPTEFCCEVQVRSILQHTYAELVHDNIYKADSSISIDVERQIARSMALMETTDELFSNTLQILTKTNELKEKVLKDLLSIYSRYIGLSYEIDKKTNMIFLDDFYDFLSEDVSNSIENMINDKKFIVEYIKESSMEMYFFKQPIVLLAYWLVEEHGAEEVQEKWPFPAYIKDLKIIFSNLDKQPSGDIF